tara:strand:+ start:28374 stop:28862 length:489 start_codon:yes stop_codon:yes gene_type:complete
MIGINLEDCYIEIEDYIAKYSNLIRKMYFDEDHDFTRGETKQDDALDIKWISSKIFNKYIEFCKIIFETQAKHLNDEIKDFLENIETNLIFKLLNLCNFLDNQVSINIIKENIDNELNNSSFEDTIKKYSIHDEINSDERLTKQLGIFEKYSMDDNDDDDDD